jgi:protein gp37
MGKNTKIEWATHTWNPWIGCQKVSPGCDHCYAEAMMDHRYGRVKWGPHGERKRTSVANWRKPLRWAKQANGSRPRVFCASLADVFDNKAPEGARADLFALIRATPELDWLLLTKRPENIRKMLPEDWGEGWPHVWLGTTVENQDEAQRRLRHLLNVPARVHFLSCEPLLGPINLSGWLPVPTFWAPGEPFQATRTGHQIDWIICGGESGTDARPMHPDWARGLRDQCDAAGARFFFKQWGEWAPKPATYIDAKYSLPLRAWTGTDWSDDGALTGEWLARLGKKNAGRELDGRTHDAFPEIAE